MSEPSTHLFRVTGILAIVCIMIVNCSTTEDLSKRPLYSINEYLIEEDVRRSVLRSQLLIAKELGPEHQTFVTLEKYAQRGDAIYSIAVQYVGSDLRNLYEIILMIDGETITLTDGNPSRIHHSDGRVIETVSCLLDEHTFKGLRYCEYLEIQYDNKSVVIPQEGREAIWNFLKNDF